MAGIDFSTLIYLPAYDLFAVPVTVNPVASQPGQPTYAARGIYTTDELDVEAMDGSIISDQKTILDIRDAEFTVLPRQHDRVTIALNSSGQAVGEFEIVDVDANGGGQSTLTLKKWINS